MQRYKEMKNEKSSMKNYFPYFLFFIITIFPVAVGRPRTTGWQH